jgi:hypothetical protein
MRVGQFLGLQGWFDGCLVEEADGTRMWDPKTEGGGEKSTKATISIHCEPSASIGSTRE